MSKISQLKKQIEVCCQQITYNSDECHDRYQQLKLQAANDWHDFKKLAPLFMGGAFVISLMMASSKRWRRVFMLTNKYMMRAVAKSQLWMNITRFAIHSVHRIKAKNA